MLNNTDEKKGMQIDLISFVVSTMSQFQITRCLPSIYTGTMSSSGVNNILAFCCIERYERCFFRIIISFPHLKLCLLRTLFNNSLIISPIYKISKCDNLSIAYDIDAYVDCVWIYKKQKKKMCNILSDSWKWNQIENTNLIFL